MGVIPNSKMAYIFQISCILVLIFPFLYPATLKSVGYYIKLRWSVPLSVHLYVRLSVNASFSLTAGSIFKPIFFQFAMRVDIGKECPGIADG